MSPRKKFNPPCPAVPLVPLVLLLALAPSGCGDARRDSILVEPPVVRLVDRVYPENEYVSAKFRLVNPFDKPITVTDISTSCACTMALVDGGRGLPAVVRPKETLVLEMKAFGTAKREPFQSFAAVISAEHEGRPLPDATATLQFRVEDPLKAFPQSLVAAGLPPDTAKLSFGLVTRSASAVVPPPVLRVSCPESMRVELHRPPNGPYETQGLWTHYTVDVTITPGPDESAVTGVISVVEADRVVQVIPVDCSFKAPYGLSPRAVDVEGFPGDCIRREIFYEARDPGWRDVAVASTSDDIGCEVSRFDETTQRLRLTIKVPAPGALPSRSGVVPCVILRTRQGDHEIKIPVRYHPRGGTNRPPA